jgi:hypothetical protein
LFLTIEKQHPPWCYFQRCLCSIHRYWTVNQSGCILFSLKSCTHPWCSRRGGVATGVRHTVLLAIVAICSLPVDCLVNSLSHICLATQKNPIEIGWLWINYCIGEIWTKNPYSHLLENERNVSLSSQWIIILILAEFLSK